MNRLVVKFLKPYRIGVLEEPLPALTEGQVMVKTICSAISAGTELLLYRGHWPEMISVDETIPALASKFQFPLKYGYSAVGRVIQVGPGVSSDFIGRPVFSFNPHESHFAASLDQLIFLPSSLKMEDAAFLPNMETAVGLVMDGRPIIGEQVIVLGQGVVGLLTTALLSRMLLSSLITVDAFPLRREKSVKFGAHFTFDPTKAQNCQEIIREFGKEDVDGADLVYELSGNPAGLQFAIDMTGFSGRIVVGSWYGTKRVDIDLGGRFHRYRMHLISSQVSRLAPELTGLWTKSRRLEFAMRMLEMLEPSALITHRFPVSKASEAYDLLDEHPEETIQVMLYYEDVP